MKRATPDPQRHPRRLSPMGTHSASGRGRSQTRLRLLEAGELRARIDGDLTVMTKASLDSARLPAKAPGWTARTRRVSTARRPEGVGHQNTHPVSGQTLYVLGNSEVPFGFWHNPCTSRNCKKNEHFGLLGIPDYHKSLTNMCARAHGACETGLQKEAPF